MIELSEGDLLEAKVDALVNAVNTEGVMGKGIALQFKQKFPDMFEAYRRACKAGEVRPGSMHVFRFDDRSAPRFIINFPTKRHWRSPSRLEDIEAGLLALAAEVRGHNIRSIAVPALGCGNGGLEWQRVFAYMKEALEPLEDVRVLVFPPEKSRSITK